jgi:hypothetical protein
MTRVSDRGRTVLNIRSNRAGVFDTIQCSLYFLQPEAYWKLESTNGAEFWWRFP